MASGEPTRPQRAVPLGIPSFARSIRDLPEEEACLVWIWRQRFSADGEHAECPRCGVERKFKRSATKDKRRSWTCSRCGHHLHPTAGTLFHKSSTPLALWFYAGYLILTTTLSITDLALNLGVRYKTAWRMNHHLRNQIEAEDLWSDDAGSTPRARYFPGALSPEEMAAFFRGASFAL